MLWRRFLPAVLLLVAPVWAVVCPGGKVKCPDNMTCCSLANHEFGCCTYPEAQCCNDHVHCCPHDMKCDERHQACLKNGFPSLFFSQISVKPELVEEVHPTDLQQIHSQETNHIEDEYNDQTCPDGHVCPNSFTCCKMFRGRYGCCPYSDAKCCRDGFHCCPHGSQCDPQSGGCQNAGTWLGKAAFLMKGKMPSRPDPPAPEVADPGGKCPDGHPCLEKFTCCKVKSGGYGCCAYTDAICCTDLIHCCPKNTNCNTSTGTCDKVRGYSVPAYSMATLKLAEIPPSPESSSASAEAATDLPNGICPDQRSKCNPGQTCCQTVDGSYGCCPFPQATCCSDHESCCPSGYQCAAGGLCQRLSSLNAYPFLPPIIVQQKPTTAPSVASPAVEAEHVNCPDGSRCPDGNTCCHMSSSRYGCCPMPRATCCRDMQHCCPHGYRCGDQGCERQEGALLNQTLVEHTSLKNPMAAPSVPLPEVEDESVNCPDGSFCPDGNTCCSISSSRFGCCPMPRATCCSDMEHCCPHGYRCADPGCERQEETHLNQTLIEHTPLKKLAAAPSVSSTGVVNDYVNCPDGSMCPDGNTCCSISSSRYGCCPMPQATCCGDMQHCCPHGYWCADQGCERLEGTLLNQTLIVHNSFQVESPKVILAP